MELIVIKVSLWARLGEISHLTKQSMTGLHELLPVCMYVLYQYGPMTEFLEGDLGWAV